ncbi:matrixin family metalloprotease [Cellulomonas sp.]|uniref:matrixin family metalloprotease n=1 Tax=Cellulomonas sp. TaxID=40001 RepID=UPI003BA93936
MDGPAGRQAPDDLPRSPSGRVPQWVIDEAADRGQAPQVRPRARARRSPVPAVVGVLVLALVAGGAWVVQSERLPQLLAWAGAPQPTPTVARNPDAPTPGTGAAAAPLGTPAPVTGPSTSFAYMALQDDRATPIAYDPCRPIHYVTRPDAAPEDGQQLITDALARISLATGLQFVDDGTTTEAPSPMREPYQLDRYGDRWAPVLFSWSSPREDATLAGFVAGAAGSAPVSLGDGPDVYVTGQVMLDAPQLAEAATHPGGDVLARATVLHEVGHLVGLGHVEDTTQLMFPEAQEGVTDLGAGDLTGLAELGRGACVPEL